MMLPDGTAGERSASEGETSLGELALLFSRLGTTAFGGPAAHIAMMQDEVVRRRRWMTEETFLDLLGATNLIPGPNSTEMAIHVGWARRRWAGLIVAGLAFIVPAMLLAGACGFLYVRYGALPEAGWLLYGVKPVILGVVAQAILSLWPKAAKTSALRWLAALAALLAVAGLNELLVLLACGVAAIVWSRREARASRAAGLSAGPLAPVLGALAAAGAAPAVTLPSLFWVFFKTGSVLYGSGYVLLAFLRNDLVERLHWLTPEQLIDAIAVGQVTPGPVFTTATFVGYLLRGPSGALVATLGIFLPAFIFVAASGPLIPRLRASKIAGAFLDGVNVGSLALMAVVTVELGRTALVDLPTVLLAAVATGLLVRYELNSTWLIAGGAAAGLALHLGGLE
jgi:chromate transporter